MSVNFGSEPPEPELESPTENKPYNSRTVLLADDEEALLEILGHTLRTAGYCVLEATDSEIALKAIKEHAAKVDLLIADIHLPESGGVRLFEEMLKVNPDMSAIFISGHPREVIVENNTLPNGAAFLEKPFDHRTLLAAVRPFLC